MANLGDLTLTGEREDSLVQINVTASGNLEVREQRWATDSIGQRMLVNHRYVLRPGDPVDKAPERVKKAAKAFWDKAAIEARRALDARNDAL